jgi:parallel beta-helix repeat protein
LWLTPLHSNARADSCTHYVSGNSGDDANDGSLTAPWKTIQKAANTATAGNIICARAGAYAELITINVSGSETGGYITFQNYPGEQVLLDGSSLTAPEGWGAMIRIDNREYIIIKGFEIANYKTSQPNHIPIGILISEAGNHIELRGNIVHNIETNYGGMYGGDAHGIAVYGTSALSNIIIDNNQLYNLKLGSSEALVVNGNVNGFEITNNIIHDNNNIGIDAIGFEGTAPSNDQARNGLIKGNTVYNINSFDNPAYGNTRSASCIYVDGGTQIIVENNTAHHCNVGVELASEHQGKSTSYITLRNNLIYSNTQAGIGIGGYDTQRGSTDNSAIINNTLYNNATQGDWGAELYVQYNTRNNIIQNNIISNPAGRFIENWSAVMSNNSVNYNLYFFTSGTINGIWRWKNTAYATFSSYQQGSGNDANSFIGTDPLFADISMDNFQLQANSPAINTGNNATCAEKDYLGTARPLGVTCDIGFFEINQYTISGNAGIANANLNYTDVTPKTVKADETGAYILGVSPNWSGAVTPSKNWHIFLPNYVNYTDVTSNIIAQNYTAIAPPTSIFLSNNSVRENQAVGAKVGTLTVRDIEANDSHIFNLHSGVAGCASTDNASFSISGVQLKTKTVLDYEAGKNRTICIRVTDSNGLTIDRPITITILTIKEEVAPQTSVKMYPKRISGTSMSYVFTFASSEANSRFMCKLDAGAYTSCISPNIYSKLSEGPHTFHVYAIDLSGNADQTPSIINFNFLAR